MSKNLLQDMVKIKHPLKTKAKEEVFENQIKQNNRGNKKPKYRIYFVALVSVVFLLFALSFLFSGAKITIIPKTEEISVNENLTAVKNSSAQELSFDLVIISGEENKTIQGGEMKNVSTPAQGTVLIYNSFSSSSQVLAIDTRLEGSNGKIYKTSKKITVPGIKKDGNPGSVEVKIYGAEAGEEYNSDPLDFKILGFNGTPKYSKFYARSKGAITGGFEGKSAIVSSLDKTTTVSELKTILEAKLLKKIFDQIPSGFVLFKEAVFASIDDKDVSFVPDKDGAISVNVKGTAYGFLFDEEKLTKKIAQDIIEGYDNSEVYMPNIKDLTFSLPDKENISFADVKNISFTLAGTPKIIWKVDETKFIDNLLGKKKTDFNQILALYPNISSAELVIRPFWKTSFPDKSENIEVIVNYP